jgi:hypothetical protein
MENLIKKLKEFKIKCKLVDDIFNKNIKNINFLEASEGRVDLYGKIINNELIICEYNNGNEKEYHLGSIETLNDENFEFIKTKVISIKEYIKTLERCVWTIGDSTIEFKNGSMQYHNEKSIAQSLDNVCYFYYDVEINIKVRHRKNKKYSFHTHDFPKVQNLHLYIDMILNNGYLLEDLKDVQYQEDGIDKFFHRKIFYHQVEICDFAWGEYFIRFERYDYEVKQASEEDYKMWTVYKMTIGEIPYHSKSEVGEAIFFNELTDEDLLKLREIALRFTQKTIEDENDYIIKQYKTVQNQES